MFSNIYQVGEKPIPKEEYLTKHNLYDLPLASIADYFEVSDNPEFQIEQLDKWLSRNHLGRVEENCIVLSGEGYLQSGYFRLGYQEFKEITKQLNSISYERFVQYETKWVSERSVWMLRSDALLRYSFFYRGDNDYRNSSVSFCNAAPLLISDFFSAPLAKQKETRYNMTERTELVIFKEAWAWLLPITRLNSSARRC